MPLFSVTAIPGTSTTTLDAPDAFAAIDRSRKNWPSHTTGARVWGPFGPVNTQDPRSGALTVEMGTIDGLFFTLDNHARVSIGEGSNYPTATLAADRLRINNLCAALPVEAVHKVARHLLSRWSVTHEPAPAVTRRE